MPRYVNLPIITVRESVDNSADATLSGDSATTMRVNISIDFSAGRAQEALDELSLAFERATTQITTYMRMRS